MAAIADVILPSVLSICVTGLNAFCLMVMYYTPTLQRPSHLANANLLAAHLVQGLVVMPLYAVKRDDTASSSDQNRDVCTAFRFFYMITNYWSCLGILIITIDRVLAVTLNFSYRRKVRQGRMIRAIVLAWIYVVAWCIIPFFAPKTRDCAYNPQWSWTIIMLISHNLAPFFIVLVSYIYIFCKVSQRTQNLPSNQPESRTRQAKLSAISQEVAKDRARTGAETVRVAWTAMAIVVTYVLCWGPSAVYYLLSSTCQRCFPGNFAHSHLEQNMGLFIKLLTFANGILAPGIYCFSSSEFKQGVTRLRRKMKKPQLSIDQKQRVTSQLQNISYSADIKTVC